MARILYLHGLESSPNAGKATRLREEGHEVVGPQLDHASDLTDSIATAQEALDAALAAGGVDVVVASSRGGAVATAIDPRGVPMLLLCPAWKRFGIDARLSGPVRILHAAADDLVGAQPFELLGLLRAADRRDARPAPLGELHLGMKCALKRVRRRLASCT